MRTVNDKKGNRIAYASKDREGKSTRYVAGHDLGNPNRGAMDREINTPLGTLGYGYDGNTDYVSYQTPYVQNYPNGTSALMSGGQRMGFVSKTPGGGLNVGIDNIGSPTRGVYDGQINTPLATLGYGYDGDTVYANAQPKIDTQRYLQALVNLIRGQ